MDTIIATKKGYKQTEIGLIPNEWELLTFGSIFNFLNTATYSRDELNNNSDVKYIHYGDIHTKWNHFLDFQNCVLPSITNEKVKNYSLIQNGDLIMADASEDYSGIGKCVEVKNIGKAKAISGLHTFLMRDKGNVFVNGFRGYIHTNSIVKKQFDKLATGMKVYGVSKTNLKTIFIPIPPVEEQIQISSALSDIDSLIISLEKLIIKKRMIRQGVIKKLLTPKKEWGIKKLGEICEYKNGKSFENYVIENGTYNLITLNSIDITGKLKKEHLKINLNDNSLSKGDLIMILSDVAHGYFLGLTDVIPENNKYVLNQRIGALKNLKNVLPSFLSLYINFNQAYFKKSGKGSSQQNLGKDDILKFEISLPSIEEQSKIATILIEIDSEITLLEKKLEKQLMIKQAMMQQLLTGKIRINGNK